MSEREHESKNKAADAYADEHTHLIPQATSLKKLGIEPSEISKVEHAVTYFDQIRKHLNSDKSQLGEPDLESANADHDSTLLDPAVTVKRDSDVATDVQLPEKVDRFEIIRVLGQGGFARVFLARDPKLNRLVALKILKPTALLSGESRLRFQREAHAAAILSHPNIVPVFESGATGPIHFLVSEYCDGQTLAEWLKDNGHQVSPDTAAKIVARLAEAVQHAHQKGVVHRDLKPGNILVHDRDDDEEMLDNLRITDFGLARLSESDTDTLTTDGAIVGTPAYMSPEQARGDKEIDHSTDLFSLGVILYELLTGRIPFRGDNHIATLRLVEAADPESLRSISPHVPRDLEAICLKALEKNAANRYRTAHDFGNDLSRWSNGLPVIARPVRPDEKAWRWCQRNPGLATAISFAFVSLALGLSLTTWKWLEADRNFVLANKETKRANEEAANAREAEVVAKDETVRANKLGKRSHDALQAFKFAFMSTDPNRNGGPEMTARDVLDSAAGYLPIADFDDEGKLIFYDALFSSYQGIGDFNAAAEVGEQWQLVAKRVHGENSSVLLDIRAQNASLLARLSRYDEARDLLTDVLAAQLQSAPDSKSRYWTQFELGRTMFAMGNIVDSIEPMESGLDGFSAIVGQATPDAIEMTAMLGAAYLELENVSSAATLLNQAYENARRQLPDDHTLTLFAKESLSRLHAFDGEIQFANRMQNEVLKVRIEKLGLDHPQTLASKLRFVRLLHNGGQLESARKIAEETLQRARDQLGDEHRTTLMAMLRCAEVLTKLERFDSAILLFEDSLQLWTKNYPEEKRTPRSIRSSLGTVFLAKGRKSSDSELVRLALANYEQNVAELNAVLPANHKDILVAEKGCAHALFWLKEYKAAEAVAEKLLNKLKRKYPGGHPDILGATNTLAVCYTELDRVDDAIEMFEEILAGTEEHNTKGHTDTIVTMVNFGTQLNSKRRFNDAKSILSKALGLAQEHIPNQRLVINTIRTALAMAHRGKDETDQAIELLEKVIGESGNDPRISGASNILQKIYSERKQFDDFLRVVEVSKTVLKKTAGQNMLGYTAAILPMANKMMDLELYDEAIAVYRECLEIRTGVDPEAWYSYNLKSILGNALLKADRMDEARSMLTVGYEGLCKTYESVPLEKGLEKVRASVERLLKLSQAEDDQVAMKRWQSELDEIDNKQ